LWELVSLSKKEMSEPELPEEDFRPEPPEEDFGDPRDFLVHSGQAQILEEFSLSRSGRMIDWMTGKQTNRASQFGIEQIYVIEDSVEAEDLFRDDLAEKSSIESIQPRGSDFSSVKRASESTDSNLRLEQKYQEQRISSVHVPEIDYTPLNTNDVEAIQKFEKSEKHI
jgi:hypothetical protein